MRVNGLIRTTPIRLINENNEQVGIVELPDAISQAKAVGLDLVEVAPGSKPPVCRIMDYGKWKYQQKKKEQKARTHSKQSELKEVRLRPKIDAHDLTIKTNKARQFLGEGDKVQFTMQFRGREMAHRDLGLNTLHLVRDQLAELSKVETLPRMTGRRMTMVLAPDQRSNKPKQPKAPAEAAASPAPKAAPPSPASAPPQVEASQDQPPVASDTAS